MSWLFVMSWNGIGVEGAACYVAECRDPHRDAKIAMTAEGLYGLFVYAGTAIVFVAVLGASLTSSDPLTAYTDFADHIFGSAGWVKYLIGIPLIFALMLSVLNAIMGVGRSLFQASEDRLIPKFFSHKNKHNSPDHAMFFNLGCALVVGLFGSPVRIYIFSNVGYLIAIVAALVGYFMVRQFQPDKVSPFRLPGYVRWIALAMGLFLTFVYFVGGWGSPDIVVGPGQGHTLYLLGFAVVARLRALAPVAQDDRSARWRGATEQTAHRGRVTRRHRPRRDEGAARLGPGPHGCRRHGGRRYQPCAERRTRCRLRRRCGPARAAWEKSRSPGRVDASSKGRSGTHSRPSPPPSSSPPWAFPSRRR